jgi:hypothetical protein
MNRLIFLFILVACNVVYASFDRQYEYRSFSVNEMEVADYFSKIDAEYTSDILTYSFSPEEEVNFQQSDKKLIMSLGSLSRREFMKDARLKIKHALSEKLDFKYNYVEQKDFENTQNHSVIELVYKPFQKFHASIFADLDFAKVNNNVGFSFSYLPQLNHEIKFFLNMVQYDRNKRNHKDDRFEKKPYTFGFVGRYHRPKYGLTKYFEYGFLNETNTEWVFPTEDARFNYRRWMGTLRFLNPLSEKETLAIFLQSDHRSDQAEIISTSNPTSSLDLKRNQLQVNYRNNSFENFDWEAGSYIVRRDVALLDVEKKMLDVVPYAIVHFNRDLDASGYWSFGYDVDINQTKIYEADSTDKTKLNHRGNIYWTARFRGNAYLKLAATLDVDDISWEGGNGQLVMEF